MNKILSNAKFNSSIHTRNRSSGAKSYESEWLPSITGNGKALEVEAEPSGCFRIFIEYGVEQSKYQEVSFYIRAQDARYLISAVSISGNNGNRLKIQDFIESRGIIGAGGNKLTEKEWRKIVIPMNLLTQGLEAHEKLSDIIIENATLQKQSFCIDEVVLNEEKTAHYYNTATSVGGSAASTPLTPVKHASTLLEVALTVDLLDVIFKFLPFHDILAMRMASKSLYQALMASEEFLERACIALNEGKQEYIRLIQRIPNRSLAEYFEISMYERNLVKNPCGVHGTANWKILENKGDGWAVENWGQLEGKKCCFVSSYIPCKMQQVISLAEEGYNLNEIHKEQPAIEIYDHVSTRPDCGGTYTITVKLLGSNNNTLDLFQQKDSLKQGTAYKKVSHTFTNYGEVHKIEFTREGCDTKTWAGWYGTRFCAAGARVRRSAVKSQ